MTWKGKKSRWCSTISFSLLLLSPCVSFKLYYVMQFGGQGKTCKRIKKLLMILRWFLFFFLSYSSCGFTEKSISTELNEFKLLWTPRFPPFLSIIPFLVFYFVPLDLWIKNTQRHSRRCWIFPVQNVYWSVKKLQRGRRDVITRQKPNSSHLTRKCCASNSSSQMGCSCYWYYKFELGYNGKNSRLYVVVLLTNKL